MDVFSAVVLGTVQGLTEFLPISSSGHLIIAREVLGLPLQHSLSFDAVLHFATAGAVAVYFRNDFMRLFRTLSRWTARKPTERADRVLLAALVLGTIPAAVAGFLFETYMDTLFRSALLVAFTLLVGSGIMYAAERYARQNRTVTIRKGFWIGLFQALALIPGMSRSGMTIAGGLFLGLTREEAARFGFLLSLPIVLGAGLKKLIELSTNGALADIGTSLIVGALAAFIVGLLVIHYLLKYLASHTLNVFIAYRIILAALVLAGSLAL